TSARSSSTHRRTGGRPTCDASRLVSVVPWGWPGWRPWSRAGGRRTAAINADRERCPRRQARRTRACAAVESDLPGGLPHCAGGRGAGAVVDQSVHFAAAHPHDGDGFIHGAVVVCAVAD